MPAAVSLVTDVRGTVICASLLSLARAGFTSRYHALLPPRARAELAGLTAGVWVPLALARDHYGACEAMDLSASDFDTLSSASAQRLGGMVLSTFFAATRAVGVTPLLPMQHFARSWGRLYKGGGVGVVQTSVNSARIEVRGVPLLRIPYFARGMHLVNEAILAKFDRSVRFTPDRTVDADAVVYDVTWS